MKSEYWPEIGDIKSIVFGSDKNCEKIYVYLHGAGGFKTDYEGQFKYPDFPSLLRDGILEIDQPFVVACCMDKDYWDAEQLKLYLNELSIRFENARIDIIGYSRGGKGVYGLMCGKFSLNSPTIINSRLLCEGTLPNFPIHIIHAVNDQNTPINVVKDFISKNGNSNTKFSSWDGDHFSIASIAQSEIWKETT